MTGILQTAGAIDRTAAEDFLYREAELLDGGHYDAWLELFMPDGIYWIPSTPGQTDPLLVPSHAYEDDLLRRVRVERFNSQYSYSLQPAVRSVRSITNVRAGTAEAKAGVSSFNSAFLVTQYHNDVRHQFAGRYVHELVMSEGQMRIAAKTILLVDADGPMPDILTIL